MRKVPIRWILLLAAVGGGGLLFWQGGGVSLSRDSSIWLKRRAPSVPAQRSASTRPPAPVSAGAMQETFVSTAALRAPSVVPSAVSVSSSSRSWQTAGAASSTTVVGSSFQLKTGRDPMLSPVERQWIINRRLQEQLSRMPQVRVMKRQKPKPLEPQAMVRLTGIVVTDEDRSAIVNDVLKREGEIILGIKVMKIYPNRVVFQYKGKVFTKVMKQ